MITRRGALRAIGALAAVIALPAWAVGRRVARPANGTWIPGVPVFVYETAPLPRGTLTFTATARGANDEWLGVYICGIDAKGGETAIEVQEFGATAMHAHPCLSVEGYEFRSTSRNELTPPFKWAFGYAPAWEPLPRTNLILRAGPKHYPAPLS